MSHVDAPKIARSAIMNKAAGVILAEVYRHARSWPSADIEAEVLQQELLDHGLAFIDVFGFRTKACSQSCRPRSDLMNPRKVVQVRFGHLRLVNGNPMAILAPIRPILGEA